MIPKILLATPINKRKEPVIWEWLEFIKTLTYPVDVLLIDNSEDANWHKRIKGFKVVRIEPKGFPAQYITQCQEYARQYALHYGYDFMFSLECDNFAQPDIVERMLWYRVDNLNVPYFLDSDIKTTLGIQIQGYAIGQHKKLSIMPRMQTLNHVDGKIKPYHAPSIGCSLFSRTLLQKIKFRYDPKDMTKFSDSFWHIDSAAAGITPYVATGLISEHKRQTQWDGLAYKLSK